MGYIEKKREIPSNSDYEIIVVGSGPSGIAAAVSAAKNGAKTLLIESQGSVGGISTTGLMSHFTGTCDSKMYYEILKKAGKKNPYPNRAPSRIIDPELLKNTYYEMIAETGVDLLLYTFCCDAIVEENRLIGIIVENKSGRTAYFAKVFIDCSGDGDVAFRSGADFFKGRESDGLMQPATIMFKVGGVDDSRAVISESFETKTYTDKGELQELASKILPPPAGHVLLYKSTLPGIYTCNMTNCTNIDGTSAESLTHAEIVCRSQMEPIVKFLREYVPGYENCFIISAASLMGIRETRHFKGLCQINENDILQARQFPDAVVRGAYFNFDVHNITGSGLDSTGVQHEFRQQCGYTIPYGCLVPEKIDGLLLSGRNISGTHMAHSNFRAMPICVGIGEAGGTAAAISVKCDIKLRDVSPEEIRKLIF